MTFQIQALDPDQFEPLFSMTDAQLAERNIRRSTVTECPGVPCRVSLAEAQPGETVLLLNYEHLPAESPYRASHAIYVRKHAAKAVIAPDEVPFSVTSRLIAVRGFSADAFIVEADVVDGTEAAKTIADIFANPDVAFIQLHNAKHGCFAAQVERAG